MEDRRHERKLTDRSEESLLSAPRVRVYQEKIEYHNNNIFVLGIYWYSLVFKFKKNCRATYLSRELPQFLPKVARICNDDIDEHSER